MYTARLSSLFPGCPCRRHCQIRQAQNPSSIAIGTPFHRIGQREHPLSRDRQHPHRQSPRHRLEADEHLNTAFNAL